jgi:hypothetical protein
MRGRWPIAAAVALAVATAACGGGGGGATAHERLAGGSGDRTTTTAAPPTSPPTAPPTTADPLARPAWLGTRVLPLGADDTAAAQPTPPELDPRRIRTVDVLPPPTDGAFHASIVPVPAEVAARSTWQPACPVSLDDLRYVTVSFRGFDDLPHTGELLVHHAVAEQVVAAFDRIFAARFPIEEMRITSAAELDAPPTGDGNNTSAFACRPTRGSTSWSSHAYGRAVDVNPFQNPYHKGDRVLPELASSYLDRANLRPGMIIEGDPVAAAFDDAGWTWGGRWTNPVDYMHFSADGR